MRFSLNKKILLGGILLVGAVVLLFPQVGLAQAQPPAIASFMGAGIRDATTGIVGWVMPIFNVGLMVLQYLLVLVVGIAGYLLDGAFSANIEGSVASMPFVSEGWRIARDIANAFFILIILWIAFTIIFSFEQYGGKNLLVRTVVIALLINFSLVFVSVTFGFANVLAKTFATSITPPDGDIAGFMANAFRLQGITNTAAPEADTKAAADERRAADLRHEVKAPTTKDKIFAAIGVQTAKAQGGGIIAGCIAAIWFFGVGCVGGAIAGGLLEVSGRTVGGALFSTFANQTVKLLLSNIMLALGAAAMLIAAIALYMRIVMMQFLSVVAPLAFLAQLIPNKDINKYWGEWLGAVVRWAFFAPMFYFLFYLIMVMLNQFVISRQGKAPVEPVDIEAIFVSLFAIFMLIAAVKLARKTGGAVAETAISLGKQAGLAIATGGTGLLASQALPRLGQVGTTLNEKINNMENPYMRQLLAAPAAGFRQLGTIGRQQIKKEEDKLKDYNADELKAILNQAGLANPLTSAKRAAVVRRLADLGELAGTSGSARAETKRGIATLRKTGGELSGIHKVDPTLAEIEDFKLSDEEKRRIRGEAKQKLGRDLRDDKELAEWHAWSRIKDASSLDAAIFKSGNTPESKAEALRQKEFFLAALKPENFTQFTRKNPVAAADVASILTNPEDEEVARRIVAGMDARKYGYFATNTA
ncbi:MAG: Uncharacterized protein G01um101470_828, partial [Parcubacteria group bacterium Gr01-1014_70]